MSPYNTPIWDPYTKNKIGLKQYKGGLHAGPYITSIIDQVLQPCLNSLLGGPLHRDGQMRVYVFSSILSMGLWQYFFQIIYSLLTEFPITAIQGYFARFKLLGIITSTSSFRWLCAVEYPSRGRC